MDLAQNIKDAAENHLKFEGDSNLPAQLAGTDFYLASSNDDTVIAYGVIAYQEAEYKIGPKKQ